MKRPDGAELQSARIVSSSRLESLGRGGGRLRERTGEAFSPRLEENVHFITERTKALSDDIRGMSRTYSGRLVLLPKQVEYKQNFYATSCLVP